MSEGLWDLAADPAQIETAATAWSDLARGIGSIADDVAASMKSALVGWEGEAAEAYDERRLALVRDLDEASAVAGAVATAMQSVAGSVTAAQGQLDTSWASVMSLPRSYLSDDSIWFTTETEEEAATVRAAVAAARSVRAGLDEALLGYEADVAAATTRWAELTSAWEGVVLSGSFFDLGEDLALDGIGIVEIDGAIMLRGGEGNERITVRIDPETGEQIVTVTEFTIELNEDGERVVVNGATRSFRLPADKDLVVHGGGGNDVITLPSDSRLRFTALGGAGDDIIEGGAGEDRLFGLGGDDNLKAGAGDDYVSGGGGHDYLDGQGGDDRMFGGEGRDTLYGLGGRDHLSGGHGVDYLEGGEGADLLSGGAGDDVLSGGRGRDRIDGGAGDDVSYGGLGEDRTIGGTGRDTSVDDDRATGSTNEVNVNIQIPADTEHIRITGTPEFIERVRADLDLLRSSPTGQQLLANLEQRYEDSGWGFGWGKNSLEISELDPATLVGGTGDPLFENSYANGTGNPHTVQYLPSIDDFGGAPPVVVLQHELGHVYDYVNGTYDRDWIYQGEDVNDHGMKVAERQATGLPIDHDRDPDTPEILDPRHQLQYTENGLREEMGLPRREHYRG